MSPLVSFMIAPLICWVGLFIYLWRLDARVRELRK